jgi:glucose-1-phosphate adenylyltransferase
MNAIGIIMAGGNSERLKSLCALRAISAMPVAGSFRAIDFSLSNMSNSNINKVAVITQYNSRSLNDHLSSAKWWNLGSKQGGLFLFTPFLSNDNSFWFRGTADSIYQNISFLKRSHESYVIIASGDAIYKMDFHDALNAHIEKNADITVICKDFAGTDKDVRNFGIMELDDDLRLTHLEEKPVEPKSSIASLGIYIIKRNLLIDLLEDAIPNGRYDLVKDIIIRNTKELNIYGYKYDGYWTTLNSVKAYLDANMDFLKPEMRNLLTTQPYIQTKPKDEPPAKYNSSANVTGSLVASGTIIDGSVNNSVLYRKVFVGADSTVEDSIIMEASYIGKGCTIKNAIIDKEVVVSDGKTLIGEPDNPVVVAKGEVI